MIKKTNPFFIEDGGIYFGDGYIDPIDKGAFKKTFSDFSNQEEFIEKEVFKDSPEFTNEKEYMPEEISKEPKIKTEYIENDSLSDIQIILEYLEIIKEIKTKNDEIKKLEDRKRIIWNKINNSPELMSMIEDIIINTKVNKK